MTNKNIYMNLGGLDPELIAKAAPAEKVQKKKKNTWARWVSLAACLCLVITASIMVIPNLLNHTRENADKITPQGVTVDSGLGKLTLIESNLADNQCTFILIKENNKPLYICFRGYSVLNTFTDENGVECKKVQQYHIITPYDGYDKAAENHIVLDNKLGVTVNGEKVDSLPNSPGTYEITVDYSELYGFLDHIDDIVEVYSFGSFDVLGSADFQISYVSEQGLSQKIITVSADLSIVLDKWLELNALDEQFQIVGSHIISDLSEEFEPLSEYCYRVNNYAFYMSADLDEFLNKDENSMYREALATTMQDAINTMNKVMQDKLK